MKKRRRRDAIGRDRERLAERLAEIGIRCYPDEITPAQGRWRNLTLEGCDPVRWWATGRKDFEIHGVKGETQIQIRGYSTVKDCARHGVWIGDADVSGYEIWSKSIPQSTSRD